MKIHDGIPKTDILGNELKIGDKVTVFNKLFITHQNVELVEKEFNDDPDDKRTAIKIEGGWMFGLGNHEVIKED